LSATPDFGRFYGSRATCLSKVALAKNLPHRSREHEFTDGRVKKIFAVKRNVTCNILVAQDYSAAHSCSAGHSYFVEHNYYEE
jgi:hypothetical protein